MRLPVRLPARRQVRRLGLMLDLMLSLLSLLGRLSLDLSYALPPHHAQHATQRWHAKHKLP